MNDETTPIKSTSPTVIANTNNTTNDIYRKLLVTANKLATLQTSLHSIEDFFSNPSIKLYHNKLCNESLKLLFESDFNLDYCRKVEELIWKRIYHDIYKFQKTKRQLISKHHECLIEAHFISGIGFYSNLIIRLRCRYKLNDLHGLIRPLNLQLASQTVQQADNFIENHLGFIERDSLSNHVADSSIKSETTIPLNDLSKKDKNHHDGLAKEWARQAIYRSLVYMGDLARYLLETSLIDHRDLAFNFYRSATRSQPDYGLPFNQLATLAGDSNYNLHSVSNYMRCCLKPKPFDAAESNMRKLFQLNENVYNEEIKRRNYVAKMSNVLASVDPSQEAETMVKAIIVIFIKLASSLWSASITGSLDKNSLIEETRLFFESLREALELEPIVPLATHTNEEHNFTPISVGSIYFKKPKFITPSIMYEFCCISIMLISKSQSSKPSEILIEIEPFPTDSLKDLVNTLALNLLHYSTSKCQKMVMRKVQESRLFRQNRIESSLSDVFRSKSLLLNESNHESNQTVISDETVDSLDGNLNNENFVMSFIYTQTYLPTIKIFCDWLLANSEIIELNLQSFHSFCSDLAELNTLLREFRKLSGDKVSTIKMVENVVQQNNSSILDHNHDSSHNGHGSMLNDIIFKHVFDGPAWKQKYPLSCDFPLYNMKPLQSVHKLNIDFNYISELSETQSGFITLQCIEAFLFALTIFLKNKP